MIVNSALKSLNKDSDNSVIKANCTISVKITGLPLTTIDSRLLSAFSHRPTTGLRLLASTALDHDLHGLRHHADPLASDSLTTVNAQLLPAICLIDLYLTLLALSHYQLILNLTALKHYQASAIIPANWPQQPSIHCHPSGPCTLSTLNHHKPIGLISPLPLYRAFQPLAILASKAPDHYIGSCPAFSHIGLNMQPLTTIGSQP